MIGVIAKDTDTDIITEFFELFKTPWEFYCPGHRYDLVIAASEEIPDSLDVGRLVVYNSRKTRVDNEAIVAQSFRHEGGWLDYEGGWLDYKVACPIYGSLLTFPPTAKPIIRAMGRTGIAAYTFKQSGYQIARIGYDLFVEVAFLLTRGQPPENALIPTLELHIALLRSIMLGMGVSFVEIPPVPAGYEFITCLTHDVDFTGIRKHKWDHTLWGFLYRATLGALFDFLRGRIVWRKVLQNWEAVLSLPLVYCGVRDDFWLEFDRYLTIEQGLRPTYFFLPFKDRPGMQASGPAPRRRAAKYEIGEVSQDIAKLTRNGCEIGVHGIDAWRDSQQGRTELNRIRQLTGRSQVGIRMHWLYFDERSPRLLRDGGFSYDSTFGYNGAVGFRAGTGQVFCPPAGSPLLELPLVIQDTAMFYASRMDLLQAQAAETCRRLINSTATFGGVLTVNWHTRSLSPERLWGDFYLAFLGQLRSRRVWFGTAGEVVSWFRNRRAIRFEEVQFSQDSVQVRLAGTVSGEPALLIRSYHPQDIDSGGFRSLSPDASCYTDSFWNGETAVTIPHISAKYHSYEIPV